MNDERLRTIESALTRCALGGLIVLGMVGCNHSGELETSPVSGCVLLDGKVVTSGTVTFVPARGRASKGEIQSDGRFVLSTYRDNDGAIVGTHRAAVFVLRNGIQKGAGPEQNEAIMAIPSRYAVAEESGLAYEVKSGAPNEFTLELSSK